MIALALAGLALAGIPAGTGAPASPVATALAWLAAVAVVVLVFGAVCAIAACLLSSRTAQAEEAGFAHGAAPAHSGVSGSRSVSNSDVVSAERVAPPISRSHPVTLAPHAGRRGVAHPLEPDWADGVVGRCEESHMTIHGVTWLLLHGDEYVMLERCPKKAKVLGVGVWFVPGGKCLEDETPDDCLRRELAEEWPTVTLLSARPLPVLEGSRVPADPDGGGRLYLMRPYVIEVGGVIPSASDEGVALEWSLINSARGLESPVPQVRMMIAGALGL